MWSALSQVFSPDGAHGQRVAHRLCLLCLLLGLSSLPLDILFDELLALRLPGVDPLFRLPPQGVSPLPRLLNAYGWPLAKGSGE
jgi:hypothetical protein